MKKGGFVLVLWMMLVVSIGVGKKGYDEEEVPNNIEEIAVKVTGASSRPNSNSNSNSNSYWNWNWNWNWKWKWKEEVRKVVNKAYTYLFPPKIDFRPGKPVEEDDAQVSMKEALTRSFHNTKQMVEDSANVAAQTLQQPKPHSEL